MAERSVQKVIVSGRILLRPHSHITLSTTLVTLSEAKGLYLWLRVNSAKGLCL